MTELIEKLSAYGTVEVCNAKEVFTLLMTGENLDKMDTAVVIQKLITEAVTDRYPNLENIRNKDFYYCIVLSKAKPSDKTLEAYAEQISIQTSMEKKVEILKSLI